MVLLTTADELTLAIKRSVSHNEPVTVPIDSVHNFLPDVLEHIEAETGGWYDWETNGKNKYHVWGDDKGGNEFTLHLYFF